MQSKSRTIELGRKRVVVRVYNMVCIAVGRPRAARTVIIIILVERRTAHVHGQHRFGTSPLLRAPEVACNGRMAIVQTGLP